MKRFCILQKRPAPGRPKAGDAPSGGRLRCAADGGRS